MVNDKSIDYMINLSSWRKLQKADASQLNFLVDVGGTSLDVKLSSEKQCSQIAFFQLGF